MPRFESWRPSQRTGEALDELARNFGATIVLCTATQPALAAPAFKDGLSLDADRELAPDPQRLHHLLRRVSLRMAAEPMNDAELVEALGQEPQGLIIVNSRGHALTLYRAAKAAGLDGLLHLTTRQTAADRRRVLQAVRERLERQVPCRLIATSLVEAGVDLDFPRAWRAEAGLDQLMQAAGRVNREGLRPVEDSIVTVFKPAEAKPPAELAAFAAAMRRVAGRHAALFSPEAIEDYFGEVYWQTGPGLDRERILEKFAVSAGVTDFAYRTVAERFRMIESGMQPMIVPIDETPRSVLSGLMAGRLGPGAAARLVQPHVVQVPPPARARLIANGRARYVPGFGDQFVELLSLELYDREVGLVWEDAEYLAVERIII